MSGSLIRNRGVSPALALCLALAGALSMLYYHQGLFMRRVTDVRNAEALGNGYLFANDFYQVWFSSRELLRARRDPYTQEMTRDIQIGLYGRPLEPNRPGDPIDQRAFPYPAFTDLLFWPTAEFPFPAIRVAVVAALTIFTIGSTLLWLRTLDWRIGWQWTTIILLLTLCSYPALEALFAAQIGLLVVFLLSASVVALQRGQSLLAGVLLALCTIKPQVAALAILYLLVWALQEWNRRKPVVYGFSFTLALLLAGSLLVVPYWIPSWIHTVTAYRQYTRPPLVREVITSFLGTTVAGPATLVLTAASLVIALALVWANRRAPLESLQFWLTLSLLLSITAIAVLPGQAVYDHLILLPAIFLLIRHRSLLLDAGPVSRILLSIGTLALGWQWAAAFALTLLSPFLSSASLNSTAVLSLPIRTAASLPFAVLALLVWTWRVTSRASKAA